MPPDENNRGQTAIVFSLASRRPTEADFVCSCKGDEGQDLFHLKQSWSVPYYSVPYYSALFARLGINNGSLQPGQEIPILSDDFSRSELRAGGSYIAADAAQRLQTRTEREAIEPTWSFKEASMALRAQQDAQADEAMRQKIWSESPSMTSGQNMVPGIQTAAPKAPNFVELGKAGIGMIGNGATVVTGYALGAVGIAGLAAPEPTTLTKWGGAAALTASSVLVSKGGVGFSLNAANFLSAWNGTPSGESYLPGSALEYAVQKAGGSYNQVKFAQAVDMAVDLATAPALRAGTFATKALFTPLLEGIPALLQTPRYSNFTTQMILRTPNAYRAADLSGTMSGGVSAIFTYYELGKNDFSWWK